MTFRVSVYETSRPRRSRRVRRLEGADEHQAACFMEFNKGDLAMRHLAVIAQETSVGQKEEAA